MKIKLFLITGIFNVMFFVSCVGQNSALFIAAPDFSVYENGKTINIGSIIETKDGTSAERMPEWLLAFINGGIEAVEMLDLYRDRYVFIGINEGDNFTALSKWADNFSAEHDFAVLAAIRIENRLILSAALYPDDEYGIFFERLVKSAYSAEYRGVVKEETYWIRTRTNNQNGNLRSPSSETYNFFVLLTVGRNTMQNIIRIMMSQVNNAVSPTSSQTISINRLRQTFFQGF